MRDMMVRPYKKKLKILPSVLNKVVVREMAPFADVILFLVVFFAIKWPKCALKRIFSDIAVAKRIATYCACFLSFRKSKQRSRQTSQREDLPPGDNM